MSDDMLFDRISIKLSNVLYNISQDKCDLKPKFWLGDLCRSDNNDKYRFKLIRGCHKSLPVMVV